MRSIHFFVPCLISLTLTACGDSATLSIAEGMGRSTVLPAPKPSLMPTVKIATAVGWARDAKPDVAAGLQVNQFAGNLKHPRWL